MADLQSLDTMLRVGTVTDVNNGEHKARVKFQDDGFTSGWLYVLKTPPFIPDYDGEQKTEPKSGGSGDAMFEEHTHNLIIKPWMPKINDTVLVIYVPIRDGDGFVLGGI